MYQKLSLVICCVLATVAGSGQTYLSESFEGAWSGTPAAPAGWTNIDGAGSTNRAWEKATYSGGAWTPTGSGTKPAGAPNGSAVAHYNDFNAAAGQVDKLRTPLVDLSASADPRIAFYYCYPASSWSGSFKVFGSYDGGTTWNLLNTYSFTGTLPLWTRIVFALPASYKVSNAKFSFEVTAGGGYADLWLDYITVGEPVPPLTGTKTIKAAGGDYSSFTAAISALNDFGVGTGGVTFLVDAGLVSIEDCPAITATGTSSNPIIFQKSGTGANPLIRATGSTAMKDAGIVIAGGDYITFDGIDITVNTGSDLEVGYYLYNISATNGAQNNTIKNAKITLDRTNTSSVGIYQNIRVTPTNQASGCNNGNKYYNLTVENSYCGISLNGNSSTLYDSGCEIGSTGGGTTTIGASTPNDIGNGTYLVYVIQAYYQYGIKIFNTVIRNVTGTSSTLRATGLLLYYSYGTSAIYNNKIGPITALATTASNANYLASGMILDPAYGHTVNVYNNFISGISTGQTTATSNSASSITQAAGIVLGETSGTSNLYFNNIRMDANTNINSACILSIGTANNPMVFKNNVFANLTASQSGTPAHYGVMRQGSSGTISKTDYNDYYIPNPGNGYVGYYSGNKTTLADWIGILTPNQDQHSLTADPAFASATDLHTAGADLIAAGVTVSTANGDALDIPTDIDGETRGIPPGIGADEFNLFDRTSKAEAPATQVGSTSVPSTATSAGMAVNVLRVKITDMGSGDGMATSVTNIRLTNANPPNGANWTATIAGVKLNNGTSDITTGTPVITASFIDIPIPAGNLSVPDASSITLTSSVYLKTSGIEDGKTLQFTIPATGHGFTASGSGSLFVTDFGAAITGNVHTLTVAATRLTFSGVPATVMSNTGFSATVSATDDNGNTDVDQSFAVTLALNSGAGTLSSATGLTQPLSGGTRTWPDLEYNITGTFKIQADGGSLTQVTTADINSVNEIIVGTSTGSTQAYPFDVSFGYSRNAALYLQSEIGFFFPISKLSWQIATAQTTNCPVKIYLKKITATTLTADTWANMISGATLVYDGTVQFTPAGWFDINFSSSFTYDGGNLLVLTEGNYGANGTTSSPTFNYTTATNLNASQHADASPPTASLTLGNKRPNLRIPLPVAKSLAEVTVTQASTGIVTTGSTNQEILRLDFPVSGFLGTLFLNSITVTSNNTNDNDISGVKLFRTTSPVFSTANPLGSPTLFSGGAATFSSLGYDLPVGTTYVWVAVDISSNAADNHVADAKIAAHSIDVGGNLYPSVEQNPAGGRTIRALLSGTYTVGAGGAFTSFTKTDGLFAYINTYGLSGNVTIQVISDITDETGAVALNQWTETGAGNYTLTIQPAGATERLISSTAAADLMVLNGADRVTIDGRYLGSGKYLRFRNTDPGYTTFRFTNSAQNNIIRYCYVEGANSTVYSGVIDFYHSGNNNNNLVDHCTVRDRSDAAGRPVYCFFFNGENNASSNTISHNEIFNFTSDGINMVVATFTTISGNRIFMTSASAESTVTAVNIGNAPNTVVSGNEIFGLNGSPDAIVKGIDYHGYSGVSINVDILNNLIYLNPVTTNKVYGIDYNAYASNSCNLYFNSVRIGGTLTTGTSGSYALVIRYPANELNIKNNIFVNTRSNSGGTAKHYAVGFTSTAITSLGIDYNDYFTDGTGGVLGIYGSADKTTLADWQASTAQDAGSGNQDPVFTSPDNLRPVAGNYMVGTVITGITTDFEGSIRSVPPDVGAYEGFEIGKWLGSISSDWATGANWDNGAQPTDSDDVIVNPWALYQPHVTADPATPAVCRSLTILPGASLTIDPGKVLIVGGP